MNNNTSSLLAFVAIGVMAAVVMFKPLPTVTVQLPTGPAPIVNVSSPDVKVNVPKQDAPVFGAVTGPDSSFPCESHNGVQRCFTRRSFNSATTTVCSIKSPNATSTLISATVRFIQSSTTASTVTLAKATTPFATTTSLGSTVTAANASATLNATTTLVTTADDKTVFAPNTYFVVGMAGGVGTFSPTGACQATFEAI